MVVFATDSVHYVPSRTLWKAVCKETRMYGLGRECSVYRSLSLLLVLRGFVPTKNPLNLSRRAPFLSLFREFAFEVNRRDLYSETY